MVANSDPTNFLYIVKKLISECSKLYYDRLGIQT